MTEFFTADTHLGHTNIIKYCNRPFKSTSEMDATIINNINEVVKSDDILYHLGDFSLGNPGYIINYLERINCKKIRLILGNHDKEIRKRPQHYFK